MKAIIISADQKTGDNLANALRSFEADVQLCRKVDKYPLADDLIRVLRLSTPEVVFLSFENVGLATQLARSVEASMSGIQVVAFHRDCGPGLLRESMRVGIREFLSEPFELDDVAKVLENIQGELQKHPPLFTEAQLFSFLPSKAGVGATTLALNMPVSIEECKFAADSSGRV